jgi:16S rRNA (cytosine1402-N4)-methyltransferase
VLQQYRPRTTCSLAIEKAGQGTSSALFTSLSIAKLQMAQDHYHVPVLEREIVELFTSLAAGVVLDATLGGGGHAAAILSRASQLRLIGIDRDPQAREAAGERLIRYGSRVRIVEATFGDLTTVLAENSDFVHDEPVVGVLMDLGVSSHQLDDPTRGFSFRNDAPLDMRMDPTRGETAAELIARLDQHQFAAMLRANGESRFAGAIAKAVIERQPQMTNELSEAVERAVPMAARRRGHVATRVYQALRIAVNGEEEQLSNGLRGALDMLAPGGVIAVISYHSGEDREVKTVLHEAATGGCHCPVELGCVCGAVKRVTVFKASAQLASAEEIAANPRARSARLRMARKLAP